MASEALTAFEATLKKEPRRLGATARLGSGRRQGPATQQGAHYANAVALAAEADPVRPEIAKARVFVAKN
jgi:hypothetical protein